MNPDRLVLLDIDGTILLTAGAGRRAITAALGEHVGEVSSFQHMRFDGKTDPQIVGEMLAMAGHEPPHDGERVAALCRRYVALLERELASGATATTLMPGIERLLIRLAGEPRVALGLLTGNLVDGAELKLRAAGIDSRQFVVGAYGSDSHDRTELPAIAAARARPLFGHVPTGEEVVIIGDTPADITCGRGIGARAIAVATGAYTLEDLGAHQPWAVLPDLSDTEAVMAAILG
ncbi:MAG TPA: HAD hydrolase-like protein [Gemmatimonadales bacterium]|nr:HAD hydrolase-like protein [Gemmatimonadales bacterium]